MKSILSIKYFQNIMYNLFLFGVVYFYQRKPITFHLNFLLLIEKRAVESL